jgi:hypothetical protein
MKHLISALALSILCASCGTSSDDSRDSLDEIAKQYLFLELSMGLHDAAHVDAYFGPPEIREDAEKQGLTVEAISVGVTALRDDLSSRTPDDQTALRIEGLIARLNALLTRIAMNQGNVLPFDDEAQRLFGTSAPDNDDEHFDTILAQIDELLPGEGSIAERVVEFRNQFVIPADKLSAIFDEAINECRRRTLQHITLPEHESFQVEYVNDKPWSGYNWYQGGANSLIQVNTDLPIFISRAVDLGCHEGYPGHHTLNVLLEKNLVQDQNWIEFTLYPLFSPASLIAEGSGNYGIELAFPGQERLTYERDVLFPMAGLDPAKAESYYKLLDLQAKLKYAENEAARDYLNGVKTREETIAWMNEYLLSAPERNAQRTRFFDAYRSYIINYNLGKDMVKDYVERDADSAASRWERFEYMLSNPMLPVHLKQN